MTAHGEDGILYSSLDLVSLTSSFDAFDHELCIPDLTDVELNFEVLSSCNEDRAKAESDPGDGKKIHHCDINITLNRVGLRRHHTWHTDLIDVDYTA